MFVYRILAIALAGALATPLAAQTGAPAAAATAGAAQPAAQQITFDDAVAIALRQNTAVLQAKNATGVDASNVQQQKLSFLPSLNLNANTGQNYGRSFSQTEGAIVNQTTQSLNAGVSSSVTLFNGLKNVTSLKQAQLGEQAGNQDLARARQTAVFTVASNFLSLITAQEQLAVQQQSLTAQQALEQQIEKFVQAGTRPVSDQYQQQATVASQQATVVDAQNTLEKAKVDLIQTLQLDPARPYDFVAPVISQDSVAPQYDLDNLVARALAQRADLDAQESRVGAAQQGVKAAAASKWPSISLSAGYNSSFSSAGNPAFLDQLDQHRGGSLSIGVSIPLFDNGATEAATERAQIAADNAKLDLSSQRQQVALDVRRAYLDYQSAQQRLKAAQAQQKAADLALQTSEQRYRVGAATLVEVTQAQSAAVQAASALVNARYTLVFQQALMSYYTGELDPAHIALG